MQEMKSEGKLNKGIKDQFQKCMLCVAGISQVLLLLVVIYLLLNGLTDYEQAGFLFETQSKMILGLLAVSMTCFLFLLFSAVLSLFHRCSFRMLSVLSAVMLVSAFLLQCIFLFYYRSSYLFDSAFVTGGASSLAETGSVAKEATYYLSVYPNQNAYVVLTMVLWKLGRFVGLDRGSIPLLLNGFNMICLDLAVLLFFQIVKVVRPSLEPAKKTCLILFMVLNPFLYIGVSYYYTITISMPFFMLLLYLYMKYLRREQYKGYWVPVLTGGCAAIGYLIRPTTIIPVIAISFCILVFGRKRKKDILILVTALIFIVGLGKVNASIVGLDTENTAFPATHWIMMSLTSPGAHNEEDEAYTASFPTKELKQEAVAARMHEKLENMSGMGFVHLMFAKLKNTWGSGSNGYTVYLEHCLRTDGLYPYVFGNKRDFVILYHQGYYLFLLICMLYEITHTLCWKKMTDTYVWQLTILGGILFYLLWETSAQYSLPFLFTIMLVAASGFDRIYTRQTESEYYARNSKKTVKYYFYKCNQYLLPSIGAVCFIFLVCFFIRKISVFTEMQRPISDPVVSQLLANEELELKDGEELKQTFIGRRPFNQIIFQWRNPVSDSDAVYKVLISGDMTGEILNEEIVANGQPYNGASIFDFDTVRPQKNEQFEITIYKETGSKENNLKFVTYSMGQYDPYPYGTFQINGKDQPKDMLLSVAEKQTTPYTTYKKYFITIAGLLSFFLVALILVSLQVFHTNTSYK